MQDILGKFKDMMIAKFLTITDEFTNQLVRVEGKIFNMTEHVNKNSKWMQSMDQFNKKMDGLSRSLKIEF